MRFATVFVSASLLSSVSAAYHRRQVPGSGLPSCATDCLNNPTNLGGCQPTDLSCLCKSLPFVQSTFACVMTSCKGADQQSAITGAESICLDFGVTLAAESSAIVAGLSTVASGASVTGSAQVTSTGSSGTPTPTNSPSSARSLFGGGGVLAATVVAAVTVALSL
ncbi:hypothetical protein DFH09DRAFT_1156386 [Mycena vulgaris]|nr:hypothetical protein DFH09DRAFT_1156386 [Mycena vulgaris]